MAQGRRKKMRMALPFEEHEEVQHTTQYLPTELLAEIVNWAASLPGEPCLSTLCMASSTLRALAQPLLLKRINLGTAAVDKSECLDQMAQLATGSCPASTYARILVIDYHGAFQTEDSRADGSFLEVLHRAILAFKRAEKVIWFPREGEWAPLQKAIGRALIELGPNQLSIEALDTEFMESLDEDAYLAFEDVIGDLTSESPRLTHLEFNTMESTFFGPGAREKIKTTRSLSGLKHLGLLSAYVTSDAFVAVLRHLPSLKSLSFHDTGYRDAWRYTERGDTRAQIWDILKAKNVHLSKISTNTWNDAYLLDYINSYDGIEHLELDVLPSEFIPTFRQLNLLVALSVRHVRSLTKLCIRAGDGQKDWMWQGLTKKMRTLLFSMTNLKFLELTVCGASKKSIDSLLSSCDRFLPSLEELILNAPYSTGNRYYGKFTYCSTCFSAEPNLPEEFEEYDDMTLGLIPRFNHNIAMIPDIDPESRSAIKSIMGYEGKRDFQTPPFSILLGTLTFVRRTRSKKETWRYVEIDGSERYKFENRT